MRMSAAVPRVHYTVVDPEPADISAARDGRHGASEQWQFVNRIPSAAMLSTLGVVFLW